MDSRANHATRKSHRPIKLSAGRANCDRHAICRAKVCPFEPWKRNKKRRKNERVCYYLREMEKAPGTTRSGPIKTSNPDPADEARQIAGKISRDYILSLSPAELWSSLTRGLVQ